MTLFRQTPQRLTYRISGTSPSAKRLWYHASLVRDTGPASDLPRGAFAREHGRAGGAFANSCANSGNSGDTVIRGTPHSIPSWR